jgi:hypothetical protein
MILTILLKLEEETMSYRFNPVRTRVRFFRGGRTDFKVLPPDECYANPSDTRLREVFKKQKGKRHCIICGTTLNSYNPGPGCHAHQTEALAKQRREKAA